MRLLYFSILLILFFTVSIFSQAGGYGAPFLAGNSSPAITSVGGAGVAITVHDPFSVIYNPAHLGNNIWDKNILVSYNYNSFAVYNLYEFPANYFGLNAGYRLDSLIDMPMAVGLSLIRRTISNGEFTRTAENGEVLGKYDSYESSNEFSIGAAYQNYALFSFGLTYKNINSELTEKSPEYKVLSGNANAFDLGVLIKIPVIKTYTFSENLNADLDVSIGAALLNFGDELNVDGYNAPLPRQNSLGYSLSFGFNYVTQDLNLKILNFDFTQSAVSNLVLRDSLSINYKGLFNEMNILDNIFGMNNSDYVKSQFGIRFNILETVIYSIGNGYIYGDDTKTSGLEVSSKGLSKILYYLTDSREFLYLYENIEFSYINAQPDNHFAQGIETLYNGFVLSFKL
ncbi:MAG: hypothetical protein RO257_06625 [Candidatus Kapabacteria bacterium]|nr:hypothetical protein [Candidatus Kapabacteria bacterium]